MSPVEPYTVMPIPAVIAIVAGTILVIAILWRSFRTQNPACDDIEEEHHRPTMS